MRSYTNPYSLGDASGLVYMYIPQFMGRFIKLGRIRSSYCVPNAVMARNKIICRLEAGIISCVDLSAPRIWLV